MNITARIKQKAIALGFDLVGITTADPLADTQIAHFKSWLTNGSAGQMDYMKRNLEKRTNPARLLKGAKSIICVALNYKPPASTQTEIANFALYEDYHLFIKKRLFELADFINAKTDHPARFKACVDSGPIAERPIAQRAGLGFIGTNHMLINPELGLQILLGELVTDLQLTPDEPAENLCHNCDKCIKACPTAALASDGTFNANKCISYLTIEHKGKIPAQLAAEIGSHLFGCDECIKACPFDKPAPPPAATKTSLACRKLTCDKSQGTVRPISISTSPIRQSIDLGLKG